jgi:hypothetical protein
MSKRGDVSSKQRPFRPGWRRGLKRSARQATKLPPGPERDAMLKRARRAETAFHLDEWVNSPRLQPLT